jgi:type IV pilus assembly protein PilX
MSAPRTAFRPRQSPRLSPLRRAQRGVILFISLIVLVAMTLAGIALMRSVDTNVLIAGNLAFKQGTTAIADVGVEAARGWLSAPSGSLDQDQPGASFYWANWQTALSDFIGATATTSDDYNWGQAGTATSPDPAYTIQYVIHRLCGSAGKPSDIGTCLQSSVASGGTGAGGSKGVVSYGQQALPSTSTIFYRVTVKVTGPRNTVSYVQAVLN